MKKIVFIILTLGAGLAGGLLAIHFFSFRYIEKYLIERGSELAPIQLVETREVIIREDEAIVKAVVRVQRAVIGVRTAKGATYLEGSGIIVSSDGMVVTLADLVPFGLPFSFYINGEIVPYEVQKRDLANNLALIKVEKSGLPTLDFANMDELRNGERVFLVGTIFDDKGDTLKSVNKGIVKRVEEGLIITNIIEDKRLSGSALFNIEGKILGINLIGRNGEVSTIPISTIREFVKM